jgi:hypothetical protein
MLHIPRDDIERTRCSTFMAQRCALRADDAARYICWKDSPGRMSWCVAFESWLGKSARIHMARHPLSHPYVPRKLIKEVFSYAFNFAQLEVLLGVVSSKDWHVLRLDRWLGFKEVARLPGVHEDGGDIVLLTLWKSDCRFLENEHGREIVGTAAA